MKFYVVWAGRTPGIYEQWATAKEQVHGYPGAKYKGFKNRPAAEEAFKQGPEEFIGKVGKKILRIIDDPGYNFDGSILIDVYPDPDQTHDVISLVDQGSGEVILEYKIDLVLPVKNLAYYLGALMALEYVWTMDEDLRIIVPSKMVYYWLCTKNRMQSKFIGKLDKQTGLRLEQLQSARAQFDTSHVYYCSPEVLQSLKTNSYAA